MNHAIKAGKSLVQAIIDTNNSRKAAGVTYPYPKDQSNTAEPKPERFFGVDYASGQDKTVQLTTEPDAKQQLAEAQRTVQSLQTTVNVQNEQLNEASRKEERYGCVISEILQTLYAADPEARVSLTASQLLEILEHPHEEPTYF